MEPRPTRRVYERVVVRQSKPARVARGRHPLERLSDVPAGVRIGEPGGWILENDEVRTVHDRSAQVKQDAFDG